MVTARTGEAQLDPVELQPGSGAPEEEPTRLDARAEDATEASIAGTETPEKGTIGTAPSSPATSGAAGDSKPLPQQAPDELTRLRTENIRLSQEASQREAAVHEQRIQQAAVAYAERLRDQYESQGLDKETAHSLAVAETRAQVAEYSAKQAILRATAVELSNDYKIPREQLEKFQDETAMRQFAQTYSQAAGPQAQRIEALEKQVKQLTKSRVPAQQYDQGGQPRGSSSYAERLKKGGPLPSAKEIDAMTARYLT